MKNLYTLLLIGLFASYLTNAQKITTNSPLCADATKTLQLQATGGTTYAWKGPNNFSSTQQNPSIDKVTDKNAGVYTVTIDNKTVVTSEVKIGKVEYGRLYVSNSLGSNDITFYSQTELYVDNLSFSWKGPNNFTSNQRFPDAIKGFTTKDQGIYTVTTKDEFGCTNSASTEVKFLNPDCPYKVYTFLEGPSFSWLLGYPYSLPVCKGTEIQIRVDTSYVGNTSFKWYKDNVLLNSENKINYKATESGTYYSIVKTAKGCEYKTPEITINAQENIEVSIYTGSWNRDGQRQSAEICDDGGQIYLQAQFQIPSTKVNYQWYKNDEPLSVSSSIYKATSAGMYRVKAQIGNCSAVSNPFEVKASKKPSGMEFYLSEYYTESIKVKTVNFCKALYTNYLYVSSNVDGQVQNNNIPMGAFKGNGYFTEIKYPVNSSGTYKVNYTSGKCFWSDSIKINIGNIQDLALWANPSFVSCTNSPNVYLYSSYYNITGFTWTKNGQGIPGYYKSGIGPINEIGNYQVKYKDSNGCTGESNILKVDKLFDRRKITLTASSKNIKLCKGSAETISTVCSDGISRWMKDGKPTISFPSPCQLLVSEPGKYWHENDLGNGCVYYSDTITVEVIDNPVVSLSDSCSSTNKVILKANGTTGAKYYWYNGKTLITNANNNTYEVNDIGNYQVVVVKNGCYITSQSKLIDNTIKVSSSNVCRGDTLKLSTNIAKEYSWTGPNNFTATIQNPIIPTVTRKAAGTYNLTVKTDNGCIFKASSEVSIKDPVVFSVPKEITVCMGATLDLNSYYKNSKLTDTTEKVVYKNWYDDKGKSFNGVIANFSTKNVGNYKIIGYGYKFECITEKTVKVSANTACKSIVVGNLAKVKMCRGQSVSIPFTTIGNFKQGTKFRVYLSSENAAIDIQKPDTVVEKSPLVLKNIPDKYRGLNIKITLISDDAEQIRAESDSRYYYSTGDNITIFKNITYCDSIQLGVSYFLDSLQWYYNGKIIAGANKSTFTAKQAGVYLVKSKSPIIASYPVDNSCYYDSQPIDVTLGNLPKPQISFDNKNLCVDNAVSLYETKYSSMLSTITYRWKKDGATIYTIISNDGHAPTFATKQEGKYQVEIEQGSCKVVSDTIVLEKPKNLSVYLYAGSSSPSQNINSNVYKLCNGQPFRLYTNFKISSDFRFQWLKDGTLLKDTTGDQLTLKSAGVYSVKVNQGKCEGLSNSITILQDKNLSTKLSIAGGERSFCEGVSQYAAMEIEHDIVYYSNKTLGASQWFKDGKAFVGETVYDDYYRSYSYLKQAGSYSVIRPMTLQDGSQCNLVSDTVKLTFTNKVQLTTNTDGTLDPITKAVSFISCQDSLKITGNNSISPNGRELSYRWTKDGVTLKQDSLNYLYAKQPGTYQLETFYKGGCSVQYLPYKVALGSIKANLNIYSSKSLCEGSNITIYADSDGSDYNLPTTYQWLKDGKNLAKKDTNYYYSATQSGTYQVRVKNGKCEATSDTLRLKFDKIPTSITPSDSTEYCSNASISLKTSTEAGLSYLWERDGKIISNASLATYAANKEGLYKATLRRGECWGVTPVVKVKANILPTQLSIKGDTLICPEKTTSLVGVEAAGASYAWERDGKVVDGLKTPVVQVSDKGLYKVRYTRRECATVSNAVQVYHKAIDTNVSPADTSFCANGSVELKTNNDAQAKYQWLKDGKEISAATASLLKVNEAGKYQVVVKKLNCTTPSKEIAVKQKEATTAALSGDKAINYGDSTNISIKLSADAPWTVKLSDGKEYTAKTSPLEVSVKPTVETTYTLSEVKNACGVGTVSGSAKITVIVLGTEEESGISVQVYPMPSSEICHWKIQTEQANVASLVLYSLSGKEQINQSSPIRSQVHEGAIDLTALPSGTYLLKIKVGEKIVTRKIVKE